MARINRRPSANRRAVMPEEASPQFQPNFKDIGEDGFGGSFMDPFDPRSPGFGERMMDPTFVEDLRRFRASFGPGGGAPSGGPDTGIAKMMALSKPGALSPTIIPAGAAGVKTPGMRSGGLLGFLGSRFGGLGIGPDY